MCHLMRRGEPRPTRALVFGAPASARPVLNLSTGPFPRRPSPPQIARSTASAVRVISRPTPFTVSQADRPRTARTRARRIIRNLRGGLVWGAGGRSPSERPVQRLTGCRDVASDTLNGLAGRQAKHGKDQSDTDHDTPRWNFLAPQPSAALCGRQVTPAAHADHPAHLLTQVNAARPPCRLFRGAVGVAACYRIARSEAGARNVPNCPTCCRRCADAMPQPEKR